MLGNEAQASSKSEALRATSFSAGANNGPWLDVSNLEGDLVFAYNVGAITGSVIFKLQDATDGSGTGSADISGYATASLNTAGATGALIIRKSKSRAFVRLVATVTTGPALLAAILVVRPKTTA